MEDPVERTCDWGLYRDDIGMIMKKNGMILGFFSGKVIVNGLVCVNI